jgi:hypothetical protein
VEATKRERVIQLGAQIAGLRTEVATLQSRLAEAESELDRLFPDATLSPSPATNGAAPAESSGGTDGMFSTLMSGHPPAAAPAATAPLVPKRPELIIPSVIGNLSDQALALLKANPSFQLSGEVITNCLNQMARTTPAHLDSVNAALSRLTTDGLILRVERGRYKAKPAMNTS